MTAASGFKTTAKKPEQTEVNEKQQNKRLRIGLSILLCLLFLATAVAVGLGILLILKYRSEDLTCNTRGETGTQWIFWTRGVGDIVIHESALIDQDEQTALMVSSEATKINATNSLALHDYNTGNVALRDSSACLVSKVKVTDFNRVREMLVKRMGKRLPLQPERLVYLFSDQMTSSELGTRLGAFCRGVPAYWFEDVPKEVIRRSRRDTQRPSVSTTLHPFSLELKKATKDSLDAAILHEKLARFEDEKRYTPNPDQLRQESKWPGPDGPEQCFLNMIRVVDFRRQDILQLK